MGGQEAAAWKPWWHITSPTPAEGPPASYLLETVGGKGCEGQELFPRFSAHLPALPSAPKNE